MNKWRHCCFDVLSNHCEIKKKWKCNILLYYHIAPLPADSLLY